MEELKYIKLDRISIKDHPAINEKWVQQCIADDPSIIGLGALIVKDIERLQPRAGRLDLLLQDPETNLRYEVEIQLGATDESHIVRTIEYWDIERKRFPQYDHVAVLIAEDITSRFLNVISLLNGVIPLIAIQMNALTMMDNIALFFTTVLDQRAWNVIEEEEEQEVADRAYWENRGTKATVKMTDEILEVINTFGPKFDLKYNKFYIGLSKEGQPSNFVIFRPQKQALRIEPKLSRSEDIEAKLENAGVEVLEYSGRDRRYRIRLAKGDLTKHSDLVRDLLFEAYESFGN